MGRKKILKPQSETQIKRKMHDRRTKGSRVSSWVKLPYPAIVQVLHNLTDSERVLSAQVCRSWKQAFQNPGLWRTRHFEFGGSKANSSGQKALAFVRTKGVYLRKVFVSCRHITSNTSETITSTLEKFVPHLREADLENFHITGLELDRFWKYYHLRGKVAESLLQLLQRAKNLKVLEVSLAQFDLLPGTEILQAVSEACATKLSMLLLEDFYHSHLAVNELGDFRLALQSFTNLTVVSLNYCCVYDDLIKHWALSLRGKLTSLHIKACDNESHAHTVSDSSWRSLELACPNLTLDLSTVGIGPAASLIPILAPNAPVTILHIWSGYDNDNSLQLNDTINHIAGCYKSCLKSLHLDFDNYQDDIDDALIHLVTSCRNLKHLQLKAICSTRVAATICELIRARQSVLSSANIMLCAVSDHNMDHLRELREDMESLARERGVSLVLHNDLF
ncbi:F-box only protein 39 [Elysia marginata]|uniref:F-box only protein 39 n=1 Tax=Elysia marginata TaxID=1093978 RepID=A0AAV4G9F3_9GAST|nr:F-box only protein 39 [Elysia marginata]